MTEHPEGMILGIGLIGIAIFIALLEGVQKRIPRRGRGNAVKGIFVAIVAAGIGYYLLITFFPFFMSL